jgi:hypothetical protein
MKKRVLNEQMMSKAELLIPRMAAMAINTAYRNALTISGKVVEARNGHLVEAHSDGRVRVIRELVKPLPVIVGTKRSRSLKA